MMMPGPDLNTIPLPGDGIEKKTSAKEMLEKALRDCKNSSSKIKDVNSLSVTDSSGQKEFFGPELNLSPKEDSKSSQSIVDELFKDYISQKLGQSTKRDGEKTKDFTEAKTSSSVEEMSKILDLEINSIRSQSDNYSVVPDESRKSHHKSSHKHKKSKSHKPDKDSKSRSSKNKSKSRSSRSESHDKFNNAKDDLIIAASKAPTSDSHGAEPDPLSCNSGTTVPQILTSKNESKIPVSLESFPVTSSPQSNVPPTNTALISNTCSVSTGSTVHDGGTQITCYDQAPTDNELSNVSCPVSEEQVSAITSNPDKFAQSIGSKSTLTAMLPAPLAKKFAPKQLGLKLTEQSMSLIKNNEKIDSEGRVWEEGELSSESENSKKDGESESENDGFPSDTGSIDSNAEDWKSQSTSSSKHKKKHKRKHKKKKKKSSKEKDSKSKDQKKNDEEEERGKQKDHIKDDLSDNDSGTKYGGRRDSHKTSQDDSGKKKEEESKSDDSKKSRDSKDTNRRSKDSDRSKEDRKRKRSKSRSKSPSKKKKRSRSKSRSRSPPKKKKRSISNSRSRSPSRKKKRSRSKSRSRSPSKRKKSNSKSRSRSPSKKKKGSLSKSRSRSPKGSRREKGSYYNEWDARHYGDSSRSSRSRSRSRSRSPRSYRKHSSSKDRSRSERDKEQSRKEKEEIDLRLQIDKAKLRKIAIANALQNMKTGQGPQVMDVATIKSGGKSVEELTDFCKKISEKDKNHGDSDLSDSDDEPTKNSDDEETLIHHPFKIKEATANNIVMNIRNAKQLPVLTPSEKQAQQAALRLTFPVSSGSHHRASESEWVPVEKPTTAPPTKVTNTPSTSAAAKSMPPPPPPEPPAPKKDNIFAGQEEGQKIDIGSIISERLQAVRKLQENPYDLQALNKMYKVQEQASKWATSKQLPGQFLGSTGASVMSQQEIIGDKKHQAWAKKTQLTEAAPVAGGIGMFLLQKMGWKAGEGLGKHNEGSKEPLLLDVKIDRKGLTAPTEAGAGRGRPQQGNTTRAKDLSNKHPVSALMELCNKRRWGPPVFTVVNESGPDHKKNFLFKVRVNNVEYQPAMPSTNKKLAKAQCAGVCLQEMGLIPRDAPLNI